MPRVKKAVASRKRRKNLLKRAKGYLGGGSKRYRQAKERLLKAESNAYRSRRLRKRDFRSLWITRINGALDQAESNLNYSKFIFAIKKTSYAKLNRKTLSEIAIHDFQSFKKIVAEAEKSTV